MSIKKLQQLGRAVLEVEARAISELIPRVDTGFARACQYMLDCSGRIVVTGMGKSGHIGSKIAATLASTGSPSFFVHPGEASHGDLGMFTAQDVVIALSNSGETDELLTILPLIKRLNVPLITLTGNPRSRLAQAADINIDVTVSQEACPLGLAPTSSTTAALAMGDALAVSLLEARGFTADDFARTHPGGRLGRRLLLLISDIMHTGTDIPRVDKAVPLSDALVEMSNKRLGFVAIVNQDDKIQGIFTDGDLRRVFEHEQVDIRTTPIGEVMTRDGKTVHPDILAAEALQIMESSKINALPVVDENNRLIGAFNMHDLLRAGVV
ncbi:MAG TPA: KpsF/GutQ family sugar-phosphate isomerase [Gammaproteobacteria bacterium]|nr:KpsF/GutQ family sugar-phosphate isomerase [Gammaproteobacteria bacterium]